MPICCSSGAPAVVEVVKTKLSCKASLKHGKLMKVKDVKTKPSREMSFKNCNLKLQRGADRSMIPGHPGPFRNRRVADLPHPSSIARSVLQNMCVRHLSKTHVLRHFLQKLKVEVVKTKLSWQRSLKT